jgi:hypothetical protein
LGSSRPSIGQGCHRRPQRRRINCARDPHPNSGRKLDLDRPAALGGRHYGLLVWRNGDCSKMNFVTLPRRRLGPTGSGARLPPPNREQIRVDIMSARNLDNTRCGRQTLFHNPKLLGSGPPPSPLGTG